MSRTPLARALNAWHDRAVDAKIFEENLSYRLSMAQR